MKHDVGWLPATSLVGVLLCGCASPPGDRAIRFTEHEWTFSGQPGTHLAAEHFDLYTTVQDASWRALLPEFLENNYRKYASLVPDTQAAADGRLETYLFETRQQWEEFTRLRFPGRLEVYRLIRSGGYTEGTISVCYSLGDRGQTLAVLAHEGLHQYLGRHSLDPIPAWLNEGLATYCEAMEAEGRPKGAPPQNPFRINFLREALTGRNLIPLSELLATDAGAVLLGRESQRTKVYYSQSWALIAYLLHGENERYARSFRELTSDLATGRLLMNAQAARLAADSPATTSMGEAVLRYYFTDDLEAFEDGYVAYLSTLAGFEKK